MIKRGRGFTILEVLIFIGASSFLFISAMAAISGRQQQVQFSQSVREFDSRINDIINDVSTGFFPTSSETNCVVSGSDRPNIVRSTGVELGTSNGCLHVGKAIHFSPDDNDSQFDIYTLAGRKLTSSGVPVRSIDETLPVAVTSIGATDLFDDSVESESIRFRIRVTRIFSGSGIDITDYSVIAMLSNFEGSRPDAASVSDGQATRVGGLRSGLDLTASGAVDLINKMNESSPTSAGYFSIPEDGIVICLEDGDKRRASVTIGSAGGSRTNLQIDDHHEECDNN